MLCRLIWLPHTPAESPVGARIALAVDPEPARRKLIHVQLYFNDKLLGRAADTAAQHSAAAGRASERQRSPRTLHVRGLLPLADAGLGVVVVRPPLLVLQLLPHAATAAPRGRRGTITAVCLLQAQGRTRLFCSEQPENEQSSLRQCLDEAATVAPSGPLADLVATEPRAKQNNRTALSKHTSACMLDKSGRAVPLTELRFRPSRLMNPETKGLHPSLILGGNAPTSPSHL